MPQSRQYHSFSLKADTPDSICPLPGSPVRTSYYICLDPVCMIPRLRMWRAPPYPAGTGTSLPRMQGQAGVGIRTWISSIRHFSSMVCQPRQRRSRHGCYLRLATRSCRTPTTRISSGWRSAKMPLPLMSPPRKPLRWNLPSIVSPRGGAWMGRGRSGWMADQL